MASYKFRQDPGPQNALGVVRINMPNKHSVYMHDTPLKRLFGQSARAFSSGCVRVEKVSELVAWLLSEQKGWTLEKVEAQIASGQKLNVKLIWAVPVHFVYLTAFVGANGLAEFRPDIYGRDSSFGATTTSRMRSSPRKAARSPPSDRFSRRAQSVAEKATERRTRHQGARHRLRRGLNKGKVRPWAPPPSP